MPTRENTLNVVPGVCAIAERPSGRPPIALGSELLPRPR